MSDVKFVSLWRFQDTIGHKLYALDDQGRVFERRRDGAWVLDTAPVLADKDAIDEFYRRALQTSHDDWARREAYRLDKASGGTKHFDAVVAKQMGRAEETK
jgi:hypothetical protein